MPHFASKYFKIQDEATDKKAFELLEQYETDIVGKNPAEKAKIFAEYRASTISLLTSTNAQPLEGFNPDELANIAIETNTHPYKVLGEWIDQKVEDAKRSGKTFLFNRKSMDNALAQICTSLLRSRTDNIVLPVSQNPTKPVDITRSQRKTEALLHYSPEEILIRRARYQKNAVVFALCNSSATDFSPRNLLTPPHIPRKLKPLPLVETWASRFATSPVRKAETLYSPKQKPNLEALTTRDQIQRETLSAYKDLNLEALKTLRDSKAPVTFWQTMIALTGNKHTNTGILKQLYRPQDAIAYTRALTKSKLHKGYVPPTLVKDLAAAIAQPKNDLALLRAQDQFKPFAKESLVKIEDIAKGIEDYILNILSGKEKFAPREDSLGYQYIPKVIAQHVLHENPISHKLEILPKILDFFTQNPKKFQSLLKAVDALKAANAAEPSNKTTRGTIPCNPKTLTKLDATLAAKFRKIQALQEIQDIVQKLLKKQKDLDIE